MKPVDEGAVRVGVPTLLGVSAKTEVAVAQRKQCLRGAQVMNRVFALDERPLVDGKSAGVQRGVDIEWVGRISLSGAARTSAHGVPCIWVGSASPAGSNSSRSLTTWWAPALTRALCPAPRSTPITSPKVPAAPA